jgi:two-component system, cell cycle response regulator DivK
MPKLLLVEDDALNRDMLSRRLQRKGFDVIMAIDGEQAIETAKKILPDLILMDMGLPTLNGWETTKRLKSGKETAKIPVVGLTAHAMAEDRQRCLEAGCDAYQTKPVDFDALIAKINELLQR